MTAGMPLLRIGHLMQTSPMTFRTQLLRTLLLAGLCLFSAAVSAAADDAQVWTLPQLIEELKARNPQIEQARLSYVAAKLQVDQATAVPGPELSFQEQANNGGPFDFSKNSGFLSYYTVTQPILWPGKLRLAGDVARAQAEVVGREADALTQQMVGQLKLGYYQLKASQDQLRFMEQDAQRLGALKEVARIRYANNAAAYVDLLNAQVSSSSLENDRYALEKQIQTLREQINVMIARPARAALQLSDIDGDPRLPWKSLDDLITLARQANPAVAASRSQAEAAGSSVTLAKKAYMPDFGLVLGSYGDPPLGVDHAHMFTVGINLSFPTWFFAKERAGVAQANASLAAAQAGQASTDQQIELAVANAYHGLETALKQMKFTRERLLPEAQMAYRLALDSYSRNGGTAFSDLLLAKNNLSATEVGLIQAQSAALQAYASLAVAIGTNPD